jgi:hypothetical protein
VCIYVCKRVYACICAHIYACVKQHASGFGCANSGECAYMCVSAYMHVYELTYVHVLIDMPPGLAVPAMVNIHVYIFSRIHT